MASLINSLKPFRKASWGIQKAAKEYTHLTYGGTFTEMMAGHSQYGPLNEVPNLTYEINLVNTQLHWYLLLRIKGSKLPYLSMEITTSDMKDIISTTQEIANVANSTEVGTFEGTLDDLCQHADNVAKEMKKYNLFNNNCQTFCNKLLTRIGFTAYPPTDVSEIAERAFDYISVIILEAMKEFDSVTSADHLQSLSASDLRFLYSLLAPFWKEWKEIGTELKLQTVQLDEIRDEYPGTPNHCLREMLRAYLINNPEPPWDDLSDVVEKYSVKCAQSIRQRRASLSDKHVSKPLTIN